MRPHYSVLTGPNAEPLTFEEASAHLRIDSGDDQDYVRGLISVAREWVESITGRMSTQSTWLVTADSWCNLWGRDSGVIPIYRTPLNSVESISYYAPDATELAVMPSTDYRVITSTEPGLIQIFGDLPSVDDRPDAIQIQFHAGPSCSPATLRHSMKMVVAHLYENRLPVAFASCNEIPFSMRSLIENDKIGGHF